MDFFLKKYDFFRYTTSLFAGYAHHLLFDDWTFCAGSKHDAANVEKHRAHECEQSDTSSPAPQITGQWMLFVVMIWWSWNVLRVNKLIHAFTCFCNVSAKKKHRAISEHGCAGWWRFSLVTLRYPKMAPNLTKREPEKTQMASNLVPNLVQVVAFGTIFAPGGCSQKGGGSPERC